MAKFRIKELARAQEMSSEELARRSGVKISTVRNVWQNRVGDPNFSTLAALAAALGVRIDDLVAPGDMPEQHQSHGAAEVIPMAR